MLKVIIHNSVSEIEGKLSENEKEGEARRDILRKALSYMAAGAEWSPAYKSGHWDGRISLYNHWKQKFPTGLLSRVRESLTAMQIEYKIIDARVKPAPNADIGVNFIALGRELRFYQLKCADFAEQAKRGILSLGTGGGKTFTAAEIIKRFSVAPVVFIVPTKSLLRQTHREFEKLLTENGLPMKIGMVGDGICDINSGGVNIVTYQTALLAFNERLLLRAEKDGAGKKIAAGTVIQDELAGERVRKTLEQLEKEYKEHSGALKVATHMAQERRKGVEETPKAALAGVAKEVKKLKIACDKAESALKSRRAGMANKERTRHLIESCQCLLIDEAHIAAVVVETICLHAGNAYYRLGMTSTPFRSDNQEIRIEGALGRILISISPSDLIDLGFLCPARIFFLPITHTEEAENYHDAYQKHITFSWERNWKIKRCAEEFRALGKPTLILVKTLEHGRHLESMIQNAVFVEGGDDGGDEEVTPSEEQLDYRARMLNACQRNEIILIATSWAYTGVDAPHLAVLIMGDGGSSAASTTLQKVGRILRCVGKDIEESISNGKPEAIVIDFWDAQKHFKKASAERKRVYKLERGYKIIMAK